MENKLYIELESWLVPRYLVKQNVFSLSVDVALKAC